MKYATAKRFLGSINPSLKGTDIEKINTFGGEFLLYCVDRALNQDIEDLTECNKKAEKFILKQSAKKEKYPWVKDRDKLGYTDLSISGAYSNIKWVNTKNFKLQLNPLCEHCEAEKITEKAVLVDHKIPVYSEGDPLFYDLENLQSLCDKCHRRKTRKDHSKYSDKNLAVGKKIMNMFENE